MFLKRLRTACFSTLPAGIDIYTIFLMALCFAFCASIVLTPGIFMYNQDLPSHLEYLQYVIDHWLPLPISEGLNESFQPPLYYYLGAIFYKAGAWIGMNPDDAVPYLSLLSMIVFMVYSQKLIRFAIPQRIYYYPVLIAVLVWPLGFTFVKKINNDVLLYAFYAASFYYLALWNERLRGRDLAISALLAALATVTKSNGLLLYMLMGPVVAAAWFNGRIALRQVVNGKALAIVLVSAALLACNFGRIVYAHYQFNYPLALVPNAQATAQIAGPLSVEQAPYYSLSFDYNLFLTNPFYNPYHDETGRQFFWVSLLKTMLFHESLWAGGFIAVWMNFMLLCLWLALIAGFCTMRAQDIARSRNLLFYVFAIVLPCAALFYTRLREPHFLACAQEFRYIYPILVPFLIAYARVLEDRREQGKVVLFGLGMALLCGFIGADLWFLGLNWG